MNADFVQNTQKLPTKTTPPRLQFYRFSAVLPTRAGMYLVYNEDTARVWPHTITLDDVNDIINTRGCIFTHWAVVQEERR